jgi:hypothetical protein
MTVGHCFMRTKISWYTKVWKCSRHGELCSMIGKMHPMKSFESRKYQTASANGSLSIGTACYGKLEPALVLANYFLADEIYFCVQIILEKVV